MARALKRRAMFLFQASVMGLSNAVIIQAVDGKSLNLEKMVSEGMLQRDEHKRHDLTAGEVGCYLSHGTLLKRQLETALICEDDIVWRFDANATV